LAPRHRARFGNSNLRNSRDNKRHKKRHAPESFTKIRFAAPTFPNPLPSAVNFPVRRFITALTLAGKNTLSKKTQFSLSPFAVPVRYPAKTKGFQ
jgi:hypothetical protein